MLFTYLMDLLKRKPQNKPIFTVDNGPAQSANSVSTPLARN